MSANVAMFNMHGIINLDAMATLLTQLIQRVDQQNETIVKLQQSLQAYGKNSDINEKFVEIEKKINDVDVKASNAILASTTIILDKQ